MGGDQNDDITHIRFAMINVIEKKTVSAARAFFATHASPINNQSYGCNHPDVIVDADGRVYGIQPDGTLIKFTGGQQKLIDEVVKASQYADEKQFSQYGDDPDEYTQLKLQKDDMGTHRDNAN